LAVVVWGKESGCWGLWKGKTKVRIVLAAAAATLLSMTLLQGPGGSQGAVQASQPSAEVAVVPGFTPPAYPGSFGIPKLPRSAALLAPYHFSELPAAQVTSANLQGFDTVLLYGIRWSDLSPSAQQAIDTFAATRKVVIWDADDTGPQNYGTFVHPFSTTASGEDGKPNSVVSFPGGKNFLASPDPSSAYYLDPIQLVTDKDMINHMSAIRTGTSGWTPALVAANKSIPQGGWPVAWSYGDVGNRTGLAIYSGMDADAFTHPLNPNFAIKELALQLGAQFLRTPAASCAPSCQPPPPPPGGKPYTTCSFAKRLPRGWVHRRVPVLIQTSVATGITGKILTNSGKALASAHEDQSGILRFLLQTRRLRSNRTARLHAAVFLNGQEACRNAFRLRVDNVRPRLLSLATSRSGGRVILTLRLSERSSVTILGRRDVNWPRKRILAGRRLITFRFPSRVHAATMIVRDRAGNRLVRQLHWS
jgi:hypothetical protein